MCCVVCAVWVCCVSVVLVCCEYCVSVVLVCCEYCVSVVLVCCEYCVSVVLVCCMGIVVGMCYSIGLYHNYLIILPQLTFLITQPLFTAVCY